MPPRRAVDGRAGSPTMRVPRNGRRGMANGSLKIPQATCRSLPHGALLAPPACVEDLFDDAIPGLGIRVSQSGARSFVLQIRNPRRFISAGRYLPGAFGLAQACDKARDIPACNKPPNCPSKIAENPQVMHEYFTDGLACTFHIS